MSTALITEAAIKAARAEFYSRVNRVEGHHDVVDDVIVARGVTLDDLYDVPEEWLEGVRLALLPDGTLVVDRLTFQQHYEKTGTVYMELYRYAHEPENRRRGLLANETMELNHGAFGIRTHDVVLDQATRSDSDDIIEDSDSDEYTASPLVIVEVVVDTATCASVVNMAIGYLRNSATIERVIVFQAFRPFVREDVPGHWQVPALAMAFGLENPQDRTSRVRLVAVQSFGNIGVSQDAVDALVGGMSLPDFEPLDVERGRSLLKPGIQCEIPINNVYQDVWGLEGRGVQSCFDVPMPGSQEEMWFDMVAVFSSVISSYDEDRADQEFRATHGN